MLELVVIIPTYNRKGFLAKLLKQLHEIEKSIFNVRIIVVVDGSTDNTIEMIYKDHNEVIIIETNGDYWYTKCVNTGIKKATELNPDYILLLNDDVEIDKNYFVAQANAIKQVSQIDIIGSLSITKEYPFIITFAGIKKIFWLLYKTKQYDAHLKPYNSNKQNGLYNSIALPGRGMLIPFKLIANIGVFDTRLPQYHSDYDFTFRASKKGSTIYVNYDSILRSHQKETSTSTINKDLKLGAFLKSFFIKHSRRNIFQMGLLFYKHTAIWMFPFTLILWYFSEFFTFIFKYDKKIL